MSHVATAVSLEHTRILVNSRLDAYCKQRLSQAASYGGGYAILWQFTSKIILAGGKRFRPYMFLMAYQAYAEHHSLEGVYPAALAQELIHLSMLVHDDIIDRDLTRYGIANVMGQYEQYYATSITDPNERQHMARSSAMLAGDVLLSDAYRLLSQLEVPGPRLARAVEIMSQAVFEVVGGELLDTEAAFMRDPLIDAKSIALHKTASYSFVSPVTMGAVLAGASDGEVSKLRTLSEYLGVGYQLRDDLLGVFGDESRTGKSVTSDITEGKRTYLIEQFDATASPQQRAVFYEVFHNDRATYKDILDARQLLIASGAKAAVEAEIARIQEVIMATIESLELTREHKRAFRELALQCLVRGE